MGRTPCCDKHGVRKGAWTPEEDEALVQYINKHGHGSWRTVPKEAGLLRCGKSCRLRWINYLRPDIKRGPFTAEEDNTIIQLHAILGNRWAAIASQLPGRTDNEIKNYWNTHLKKRFHPPGHARGTPLPSFGPDQGNVKSESPTTRHMVQWESARVEAEARLSMESSLLNSWSSKTCSDFYLQLWNSEVGESFRMIKGTDVSQTSSSTKLESCSDVSLQVENNGAGALLNIIQEQTISKSKREEDIIVSESSSYDLNNSDSALKYLLDIPDGGIGFLEGQADSC
ncbi:hypothetical protein L6164_006082 [Bauhinia variegata]|uniref:Uncharacterized protein n=1 Tax=Bauhinia variegata TaxID=167791 RepID=A0ACB9PSL3_BAUVA|nr:hypothetical protein L6164_006082 [Bauhinia variegata]